MAESKPIRRALISVSDKSGLTELAQELHDRDVELVSTGGTAAALKTAGLPVIDVSEVTGFPEMMDGRVKTLHPHVHGGLLAIRHNDDHQNAAKTNGIEMIDLLIVNLYPFEATVRRKEDAATCIENIDIGGPALIRAAAKNHEDVTVIVDPTDYPGLVAELEEYGGAASPDFRRQMAGKAFARTAAYDATIANWFAEELDQHAPGYRAIGGRLVQGLRYGENPHQTAALYRTAEQRPGVATATQVQGKELSFNNLNDTDAAFELVAEFNANSKAAVAIIKHANPCGVACADTLTDAYRAALRCDPVSAFGGIIALNRAVDPETAELITELFAEVVIAPSLTEDARRVFETKRNLRVLTTGDLPDPRDGGLIVRSIAGGLLTQSRDNQVIDDVELKVATERQPTSQELADLKFAFRVAKHVKSNAIVFAKNNATVGIGAGQMSRIDSTRIAHTKSLDAAKADDLAEALTQGSVVASDAFFPFPDGVIAAADAGATAVIQPGGSIRDDEVIAAANERGLAMVLTGVRHFRH
ncbi:MAG: bifunctional phosphoribosylaminoimidazolecarboxamide formyltransferase/IMP cyclohydrolase [Pseudomonadota bacterium]